jgi:predicted dienelactone hydrolase
MGGYTVLALAGATLHLDRLAPQCRQEQGEDLSFNQSLLLQCRATELPFASRTLQDERIKAVIALNPLSSAIFGKLGLSQVQRPLMVVAGSDDVFAPAIPEQIVPFTWLTTTNKYLVPVESGTHFSFIGEENQQGALPIPPELIGPNPELARAPLKALSTAFFKIYLTEQPEYRPYLSHAYLQQISQDPYQFTIVDSLTPAQLEQTLEETSPDGD